MVLVVKVVVGIEHLLSFEGCSVLQNSLLVSSSNALDNHIISFIVDLAEENIAFVFNRGPLEDLLLGGLAVASVGPLFGEEEPDQYHHDSVSVVHDEGPAGEIELVENHF